MEFLPEYAQRRKYMREKKIAGKAFLMDHTLRKAMYGLLRHKIQQDYAKEVQ